jgi:hypothetical protein
MSEEKTVVVLDDRSSSPTEPEWLRDQIFEIRREQARVRADADVSTVRILEAISRTRTDSATSSVVGRALLNGAYLQGTDAAHVGLYEPTASYITLVSGTIAMASGYSSLASGIYATAGSSFATAPGIYALAGGRLILDTASDADEDTAVGGDGMSVGLPTLDIPTSRDGFVRVSTVAIVGGSLTSLACILSLCLWLTAGFVPIHPIVAILGLVSATGFLLMGCLMQKQASPYERE